MATGVSPRKQNLTLYIMTGFPRHDALMKKLGTFTRASRVSTSRSSRTWILRCYGSSSAKSYTHVSKGNDGG